MREKERKLKKILKDEMKNATSVNGKKKNQKNKRECKSERSYERIEIEG